MPQRNVHSLKYSRVINEALRRPWAITAEMRAVLFDILVFRAKGGRLTPDEIRARIGRDDDEEEVSPRRLMRTIRQTNGGQGSAIAVVPVYGVIAHRTFDASSGMTSTEMISAMFRRAQGDGEVGTIVLDIHSPGGGVAGVPELADEIRQGGGRGTKRVVAIANDHACSAAYWIGSQADEFVVIPTGEVGSIGVYSLHEDWSAWLEKEGIKITAMSAGERKLEGNPWEPLDAEAKAHYQAQVDEIYGDFIKAVARGRGVAQSKVKSDFGQGRVFSATDAMARGMVDSIETFDQLVSRLTTKKTRANAAAALAAETGHPDPIADTPEPPAPAAESEPDTGEDLALEVERQRMALELDDAR